MSARDGYPHVLAIPTRWMDNDVYGHVNNVTYFSYFDTVINRWLIAEGGLDIHAGEVIGVCAESHCAYHAPLAFPDVVHAGLRVSRLARSSVRYEGERDHARLWAEKRLRTHGGDAIAAYQADKNARSIDGLPAVPAPS